MTYMEIESLVAKAEVNNDFSIGYQDGMNRVKSLVLASYTFKVMN